MFEFTPAKFILIAIFLLFAFPIHEFAHAFAAYRLGDGTAKMFGRLTLNPIAHFDPVGGAMLVLTVLLTGLAFGWAKPTPVNPANLRDRRNGEVIVALAGPASNLIMAAVGAVAFRALTGAGLDVPLAVFNVLWLFVVYSVALAVFNMLPIPPLDGSALLFRIVSPQTAWQLRPMLQQYGFVALIVFILFLSGPLSRVIYEISTFLVGA